MTRILARCWLLVWDVLAPLDLAGVPGVRRVMDLAIGEAGRWTYR